MNALVCMRTWTHACTNTPSDTLPEVFENSREIASDQGLEMYRGKEYCWESREKFLHTIEIKRKGNLYEVAGLIYFFLPEKLGFNTFKKFSWLSKSTLKKSPRYDQYFFSWHFLFVYFIYFPMLSLDFLRSYFHYNLSKKKKKKSPQKTNTRHFPQRYGSVFSFYIVLLWLNSFFYLEHKAEAVSSYWMPM